MADPNFIAAIEHNTNIMALNSDAALKLLLEEAERNPGSILALEKKAPEKLV